MFVDWILIMGYFIGNIETADFGSRMAYADEIQQTWKQATRALQYADGV